ncbi:MAG TPA: phage integrase N-terminal SAM-like domain-containing protein [Hyphomicrobiales bacterium]|nr:phage integrase N-terminal SAM-like domain-containing protein [Hyphomicrobiales bacterium]
MATSPFMDALARHMLPHHYGKRTIDSYLYWIRYFIRYHRRHHPKEMGAAEVVAFLEFLAVERHVSVATQKIALNALAFLYNKYLSKPLGTLGVFNRAVRQRKLPMVLTRHEIAELLKHIDGGAGLMAAMIYASGLRRIEAVRLRVNSVDFDQGALRIWNGKGGKHRLVTVAPELFPRIRCQIAWVARLLEEDRINPEYAS